MGILHPLRSTAHKANAAVRDVYKRQVYNMMPFIASMVILAFTSKKSRAPKAEGVPYDKGAR